ncbi:GntR family transcriptional regulator [Kluyvera ascorbata]|uniref:GntR family transcriptional regulator n=1 Tax=Kluyvera ascorbata TaxID=51288 RepID=UPI0004E3F074|nr:GntR family transcriptional regulator [Kluyvera ascorbata]BBV64487.1 GntR family transcriptional regulator [Klebsiella sp. STW0522-44]HEB4875485.1 GntR family transcriptional regulator [Kluyvera ascorbata F0526]EJG2385671.1 GntR family transcriptional regulator [Kluyvera ascorbata]KFD04712.1 Uxu operon transcriptional regulator [Kluyvera ascorbata ATCC 33433]MDT8700047.1 GntR family transcriptional regulator [Kluyvera ascorbata]
MEKATVPPEKKPYQEIGDDLRAQIMQGRYPVGSRLPPERNIAETYGVSRTIVREALLMLELQGTVDIRQGSGVYVMRIPQECDGEEERMLSSDVGPFEILQARQLLESNIAAFAAKMATRADIDNLKQIIEQEQRAIALNDTSQDNGRLFHLVLAGATQNQMLLSTIERVWIQMDSSPLWQQFNAHIASRTYRLKWLGDRQTILAALRRRDVMGAWQAMGQHLENVKNSLMELSDEDAPDFDGYLFESVSIFQGKVM